MKNIFRAVKHRSEFCLIVLTIIAGISLTLSSCSLGKNNSNSTPQNGNNQSITIVAPQPSPSPVPVKKDVVLFITLQEIYPGQIATVKQTLDDFVEKNQSGMEQKKTITANDISKDTRIVVFSSPPDNLKQLVSDHPQTNFIIFSNQSQQSETNLSVITVRYDHLAFLAGYTAAMIAPDWRSGALIAVEDGGDGFFSEAFTNGGHYFCGRCVPESPPLVTYPLSSFQPASVDPSVWQNSITELQKNGIGVLFFSSSVSKPDIFRLVAGQNILLIGCQSPDAEVIRQWAATFKIDGLTPLKEVLNTIMAGKGGQASFTRVAISDVQESYISKGKQRLILLLRKDLEEGLVSPNSIQAQ